MRKIGLDKMEVRAVLRRTISSRLEESPPFLECIADAIAEVIEENNKRLWEALVDAGERRQ